MTAVKVIAMSVDYIASYVMLLILGKSSPGTFFNTVFLCGPLSCMFEATAAFSSVVYKHFLENSALWGIWFFVPSHRLQSVFIWNRSRGVN